MRNINISDKTLKIGLNSVLIILIIITRSVSFNDAILNIDETEWIYCLKKMISNPIPTNGFDANTSGPIAIYLLYPLYLTSEKLYLADLRVYGLIFLLIPFFLFIKKKLFESITYSSIYFTFLIMLNKDFLAYNTEWVIIPFLFILEHVSSTHKSIYTKSIYILIILVLPLIKFQAILFSVFFYTDLFLKDLKNNKNKELLKTSFITAILIAITFSVLFYKVNIMEFKHYYIDRNMFYSKFMKWGKSNRDIFYIFRQQLSNLFLLQIIATIITTILLIKKFGIKIITTFSREYMLIIITLITIYIPKMNFTHYYQFLFFSLTILLAKKIITLVDSSKKNQTKIAVIFLIVLAGLIVNNAINPFTNINKDTSYSDSKQLEKTIQNSTVFILGCMEAEPLYYRLRNKINFKHTSAHTYFLKTFSEINKGKYYKKELNRVITTLNSDIDFIVDPEGIIGNLNENKINNIITNKYQKKDTFKKGFIYKKIN